MKIVNTVDKKEIELATLVNALGLTYKRCQTNVDYVASIGINTYDFYKWNGRETVYIGAYGIDAKRLICKLDPKTCHALATHLESVFGVEVELEFL